jgi:phospholipase/carboxylesterase
MTAPPNPFGFPEVSRLSAEPADIDEESVRWFPHLPGPEDRVVLLLHGLGSDQEDLRSLAPLLPREFVYVSLRGIFASGAGYAWLPAPPVDPSSPEMLEESAGAVQRWIAGTVPGQVVGAIGFSQGAMLALQLLREHPEGWAWVVQLSGAPFPAPLPRDEDLAARRPPAFWGHGGVDPLFDPETEREVRSWMDAHTALVEERSEPLGHGIDEQVLSAAIRFLEVQGDGTDRLARPC